MNKEYYVSKEVLFKIENRPCRVSLNVEYHDAVKRYYYLSAVTETGLELCSLHHGYFDYDYKRSTKAMRMRTELAIVSDMADVLEGLESAIEKISENIILSERAVQGKISGTECYVWLEGIPFFSAANINSVQSGTCLSWYEHDVFNQGNIQLVCYRTKDGLRFKANDSDLYDVEKLKALRNSERFRKADLAFFKHNELLRLLGESFEGSPAAMSGLFK